MHPSVTPSSVEDRCQVFMQTVLRSGLLAREQVQEVLATLPLEQAADPKALANALVKAGKLSRFQAKMLLAGTTLGLVLGPYHILSPIGKGGMGAVYLARDTRRQQLVAVKVLPPKKARTEDRLLARFRLEMEMCQKVSHPHLTRTFEVGNYLGVYYIAMEYIPGRNLHKLVSSQGPLEVPRAARLFAEVAQALEHAHGLGLIHRDLKPSNIMITPQDRAKVLDLGLAFMQGEGPTDPSIVGGQGYILGTMDYVAPEQTEDSARVDARADIYSLGCTLYFTLSRQPPFPGGTSKEKIRRHRSEEPTPVTQLNPTVPIAFWHLLRKMMAKRPEQRFKSAAELRGELLTWVQDLPPPLLVDYPPPITDPESVEAPPENTWEAVLPALSESAGEPAAPPLPLEAGKPASPVSAPAPASPPAPPAAESKGRLLRAIPLPRPQPSTDAPAGPSPESAPPASPAPPAEPPAACPAGPPPLPLWLDFLVPVGVGVFILLVFWLLVLQLLVGH